jgi:transposase InsO family protein
MCRVLGVSCRGYYAWCNRDGQYVKVKELRLVEIIRRIHHNSKSSYGSPRVHAQLRARGISCSLKRTAKLMRTFGISSKLKRKFKATTNSKHRRPVADNIIARNFKAEVPNTKWSSDITYIWTEEGWLYLSATMDLYSRKIVGWSMSSRMNKELVNNAFKMAIINRKPKNNCLISHSDRV